MVWSSRFRLGDKGLRCKIIICRSNGQSYVCSRPARVYRQDKSGFDLGLVTCCKGHKIVHEKQGITMTLLDGRKHRTNCPNGGSTNGR